MAVINNPNPSPAKMQPTNAKGLTFKKKNPIPIPKR